MLVPLATLLLIAQQQKTAEQVYESTTPSVLTLSVERPRGVQVIGTAFLAVDRGVAVTAWHVVRGATRITAKFSDGHEAAVSGLIDKNVSLDLAFIRVDSGDRPALQLADGDPKVGSRAYVIGSPRGLDFSISDGIISQTPLLGEGKLYQFTCPVSPGNSGGPLLNSSGQVLGIVSWQLRDAQNLNFAVPAVSLSKLNARKEPTTFSTDTAGDFPTSEILLSITDEKIIELFGQVGIKATQEDDGTGKTAFLFESDETKLSLFQYANDGKSGPTSSLSMSAGYETGTKADLLRINAFNRGHRFVRAYRDSTGIVYIENDLNIGLGVGSSNFLRFVNDFSSNVHQFETEVLGRGSELGTERREFRPNSGPDGLISTVDDQTLSKCLKECGFDSKPQDDGSGRSRFAFKVGKADVCLFQFCDEDSEPTTSLSVTIGYDLTKGVDITRVNTFNEQARFVKAFVDEEGDPFLVSDLDIHGGVTLETLKAFVKSFVQDIPAFEKYVVRAESGE